jgi:protein-L-isoaspartate(D-aspartate) O-methyltransferase
MPDVERDATLREAMVSQLERNRILHRPAVAAAMRTVPRHRFLPGMAVEDAYADRAIALKTDAGEVLSSISQPGMIVLMLELLSPSPGDRVLEVGTGSGYNAALLAELVGAGGSVTTVDLDEEMAAGARDTLRGLGYSNVRVLAADGSLQTFAGLEYDDVVVTARSDDIAAAWWDALAENARLVVPLRLEGAGEYAVGFVRGRDGLLRSVGAYPCAFIALRGDAANSQASDIFYRGSGPRASSPACLRRVAEVTAVRRESATPALLGDADVVIARPISLFAVKFA